MFKRSKSNKIRKFPKKSLSNHVTTHRTSSTIPNRAITGTFLSFKNKVPQITPRTYIAPSATIIGNVQIGPESCVLSDCTLRADNDLIIIGHHSNVQESSVLHTDPGLQLIIGDYVTVGHRAMIHGCTVGDNTIVGMGATIMNRAKIGKNSIVGANALITEGKEYPDNSVLVGSPAKVVRECTEKDIEMIRRTALAYTSKIDAFMEMEFVTPVIVSTGEIQANL